MTPAAIVAQWINLEHDFSPVDNEGFGAMTGDLSDLRTGLPAQTLRKGAHAYHVPMRLLTLIEAPLTLVPDLLRRLYKPRQLAQDPWLHLVLLNPQTGLLHTQDKGDWTVLTDTRLRPEAADY